MDNEDIIRQDFETRLVQQIECLDDYLNPDELKEFVMDIFNDTISDWRDIINED